ncbi:MAG: hypothetical protein VZQ99_01190 [Treponema sp.]|nr:hypothetical protein [Treponema sp.]
MNVIRIPIYIKDLVLRKRKLNVSFQYIKKNEISNETVCKFLDKQIKFTEQNNVNQYKRLVSVTGVTGFSGSSAIGDFLGEFSNCTSLGGVCNKENPYRDSKEGFEFDFFRDAHGVYELEKIYDLGNDRIISGAIEDFLRLVKRNYDSGIYFYNDYYLYETQQFLRSILDFHVEWDPWCWFFPKRISKSEYRQIAKEYMHKLFLGIPSREYLVLDNIASMSIPKKNIIKDYFGDVKILASIRDPRDVYVNARIIPNNDWVPVDPDVFVKWYRWYYESFSSAENDSMLLIHFEDFITNYDFIASKIASFLDLNSFFHVDKFKYFNPEISKKNVGLYKFYKNQDVINYIEKKLPEFIWSNHRNI